MLRHILFRTLLIVPTLILISVIAFFLSVSTPDDYVDRILTLEGVTFDDDRVSIESYEVSYQKKVEALGKDKPLFYLSIKPSYYPKQNEWNGISFKDQSKIKNLLSKNILFDQSKNYLQGIYDFTSNYYQFKDTIQSSELKSDLKKLIFMLQKPEALLDIRRSLINFANKYQDINWTEPISNLLITIPADASRYNWHYPRVEWHGTDSQYHQWFKNFFVGEFGISIVDARPVSDKIWLALKWTMSLVLVNILLSLLISIPLSLYSAYKVNTWIDRWISWISLSIYATPIFWFATLMIIYLTTDTYGSWLNIFPSPSSFYSDGELGIFGLISKYFGRIVLPVLCLTLKDIAYLTRVLRADLIKESNKEYATMLRAKGVSEWLTLYRHILPNSLISLTTLIIHNIPSALSGALIIEVIFNIPGMGRLMYSGIFNSDWNVVFAILMFVALLTVIFYLVGDIIYSILNPRVHFNNE